MTTNNNICELSSIIQRPYAWPGGYPRYAVMEDGEALCAECCKRNASLIIQASEYEDKQWSLAGIDINWEDTSLVCSNCNEIIESAYGEDEETITDNS